MQFPVPSLPLPSFPPSFSFAIPLIFVPLSKLEPGSFPFSLSLTVLRRTIIAFVACISSFPCRLNPRLRIHYRMSEHLQRGHHLSPSRKWETIAVPSYTCGGSATGGECMRARDYRNTDSGTHITAFTISSWMTCKICHWQQLVRMNAQLFSAHSLGRAAGGNANTRRLISQSYSWPVYCHSSDWLCPFLLSARENQSMCNRIKLPRRAAVGARFTLDQLVR